MNRDEEVPEKPIIYNLRGSELEEIREHLAAGRLAAMERVLTEMVDRNDRNWAEVRRRSGTPTTRTGRPAVGPLPANVIDLTTYRAGVRGRSA